MEEDEQPIVSGNGEVWSTIARRKHKAFEKIKIELDKCMILCSNCHKEIHYSR